jgi:xanthine/uracil permease
MPHLNNKWPSVALLAICEVFALALLFSSAVAVGFVTGTLISAFLGLSDRVHPWRLFMIATFVAATSNALVLAFPPGSVCCSGPRPEPWPALPSF